MPTFAIRPREVFGSVDTVRCLLSAIAEDPEDFGVMPILADVLDDLGDERGELVRVSCDVIKHIQAIKDYRWRCAYEVKKLAWLFPELHDDALFVRGWNGIKKSRRFKFKQRILRIGLRYYFEAKLSGVLVISFASPKQLEAVKHARTVFLDEWQPLFSEVET